MDLIDRYLRAVKFWLPSEQKQDIIAELSEDLHSQIEDKESELGRPLNDAEVEAILKEGGPSMLVAQQFLPQRYLIGPALFPMYWFVLKLGWLFFFGPGSSWGSATICLLAGIFRVCWSRSCMPSSLPLQRSQEYLRCSNARMQKPDL
jgi:hypothetical protein